MIWQSPPAEAFFSRDKTRLVGGELDWAFANIASNAGLNYNFGGDGFVTIDTAASDSAFGVAIQEDGKIVAVGNATDSLEVWPWPRSP